MPNTHSHLQSSNDIRKPKNKTQSNSKPALSKPCHAAGYVCKTDRQTDNRSIQPTVQKNRNNDKNTKGRPSPFHPVPCNNPNSSSPSKQISLEQKVSTHQRPRDSLPGCLVLSCLAPALPTAATQDPGLCHTASHTPSPTSKQLTEEQTKAQLTD